MTNYLFLKLYIDVQLNVDLNTIVIYRFAFRNKKIAKIPKTILGNHTANTGETLDFSAKTPQILSKKTKAKASAIPMARLSPIPPLRFIDETATAIMVSINAEIGMLYFLYRTTK